MSVSIISRKDLALKDIVFYCTNDYDFTNNWTSWHTQDSCEYKELNQNDDIVFGCIRDGIFHYVDNLK